MHKKIPKRLQNTSSIEKWIWQLQAMAISELWTFFKRIMNKFWIKASVIGAVMILSSSSGLWFHRYHRGAMGKHRKVPQMCSALIVMLAALTGIVRVGGDAASDKVVMQAFKAGVTNSDGLGWTASDPCSWNGKQVVCDNAGNVVQLRVKSLGLTGTVTPDLHKLTSLTMLELNFNAFTGAMPTLQGMAALTQAFLDDNRFDSIPGDFFDGLTSIKEIWIDNNNLNASWQMPRTMPSTLTVLSMNNCSATGPVPSYLGTMPALTTFNAAYNSFTGAVPVSFNASGIQILLLNNQVPPGLSGGIGFIAGMVSLTKLYLHQNSFTGPMPDGVTSAVGLQQIRVSANHLVGRLPALESLPSLTDVWIAGNYFTGKQPLLPAGAYVTPDGQDSTYCAGPGVECTAKVNALLDFLAAANWPQSIAEAWVGADPCATKKPWSGISCDASGEVTSIVLSKKGLTGNISPSVAKLASLRTLLLPGNNLTGPIPTELTTLTSLQTVDVSDNNLSPPLPLFPSSVKFTYAPGNPLLTPTPPTSNPPSIAPVSAPSPLGSATPAPAIQLPPAPAVVIPTSSKTSSIVAPVVGGVVGGTVLCLLGFWLICVYCWKRSRKRNVENPQPGSTTADPEFGKLLVDSGSRNGSFHPEKQVPESWNMGFTIEQLRAVTGDFAERNVVGRGGFGVVYKGVLADGTKIAVKRMEAAVVSSKGLSEFQSEIAVLTKVKHRHLVGLLGYCTDGFERLLVYEYMSQGTLAQHLFKYEEMTGKPLSWTTRLVIALDVAQGVDYLHSLAHQSFVHRDLKPSNVLLDDDFRAKVSDFGLVKLAPDGSTFHSVESRLAGTFGYLAPEYAVTGRVTTKADVFSFGVILMELLTGRHAVDETLPDEDMYLVTWFMAKMRSRYEAIFRSSIDPTIESDETTFQSITTVAELAGHCTVREPSQRPDMGYVVSVLRPLVDEWKPMSKDFDGGAASIRYTDMSLSQALKKWQEFKDDSMTSSTATDNSLNSLPTRPSGFADSFASADGR